MDTANPPETYPQTLTESLELLKEVEAFMQTRTYRSFVQDAKQEILDGTKGAMTMLPTTIGMFLAREQALGAVAKIPDFLDWFVDRAQAIRDHIEKISAGNSEQIQ